MQTAIYRGTKITPCDMSDAEWFAMVADYKNEPSCLTNYKGDLVIPRRGSLSPHFAHRPGEGSIGGKETEHHRLAKAAIYLTAKRLGWDAEIESRSDDGEWVADVLVSNNERKIAFEVQWSSQTVEEYEKRTKRYAEYGIETVWLAHVSEKIWKLIVKKDLHAVPFSSNDLIAGKFSIESIVELILEEDAELYTPADGTKLDLYKCYRCGTRFLIFYNSRLKWKSFKRQFTFKQKEWLSTRGFKYVGYVKYAAKASKGSGVLRYWEKWDQWHCPKCNAMHNDYHHYKNNLKTYIVFDGKIATYRPKDESTYWLHLLYRMQLKKKPICFNEIEFLKKSVSDEDKKISNQIWSVVKRSNSHKRFLEKRQNERKQKLEFQKEKEKELAKEKKMKEREIKLLLLNYAIEDKRQALLSKYEINDEISILAPVGFNVAYSNIAFFHKDFSLINDENDISKKLYSVDKLVKIVCKKCSTPFVIRKYEEKYKNKTFFSMEEYQLVNKMYAISHGKIYKSKHPYTEWGCPTCGTIVGDHSL